MNRLLWFAVGFVVAAVLSLLAPTVDAQLPSIAFGSNSGTPIPIAVDSNGYLKVQIN